MTIEFATGDLFDPEFGFDAIGHGVNCQGVMGAGIAVAFKSLYPNMYVHYRKMCMAGDLHLGQVMPWATTQRRVIHEGEIRFVYNIASQYHTGRDGNLEALELGLKWVDFHARKNGLENVGLPQIGCGIAGLHWTRQVQPLAMRLFSRSPVKYTFVSLES